MFFIKDIMELIKVRILFAALLMVFLGYWVAVDFGFIDIRYLMVCFLGVGFVFSAAAGLNHFLEVDVDARMQRTQNRPLPTLRLSKEFVLFGSLFVGILGCVILYFQSTIFVLIAALMILVLYDGVYTPLKKVSSWNTFVGAIPGAMPVFCGWFFVKDGIELSIFLVFLMLYLWQLPHFYAIAWMNKESYEKAGLKMISLGDHDGNKTAVALLIATVLFIISTYALYYFDVFQLMYVLGVTVLNLCLLYLSVRFYVQRSVECAKQILLTTVFYPIGILLFISLDVFIKI